MVSTTTARSCGLLAALAMSMTMVVRDLGRAESSRTEKSVSRHDGHSFTLASHPTGSNAASGGNFLGSRSCSAVACHGYVGASRRQETPAGEEFVFWLENDPHARALETLGNEHSKYILKQLGVVRNQVIVDTAAYQNCLACHNLSRSLLGSEAEMRDGVGCESCHGPAERWVAEHYRDPWRQMLPEDKTLRGMTATKDLHVRAEACARCHVGAADREVNHDMIAAGHPRLTFELAAYMDCLPKHWNDRRERQDNPNLEFDLWQAGQVASAKAALSLLAERARRAPVGVWPELSEFDCYACHQELRLPSWRQKRGFRGLPRPGSLPWNRWYYTFWQQPRGSADEFGELRQLMEESVVANPDMVFDHARQLMETRDASSLSIESVLESLAEIESQLESNWQLDKRKAYLALDWDLAAQAFLALSAIHVSLQDRSIASQTARDNDVLHQLKEVRKLIVFPTNYDSPKFFPACPEKLSTAEKKDVRHKVIEHMKSIIKQLNAMRE